MFDLRYHVASLAAVFLALIIGIVVGVGISSGGFLKKSERSLLNEQISDLRARLDASSQRAKELRRSQQAAQAFIKDTYPTLMRGRLTGVDVALVFVGPVDGRLRSLVEEALDDAEGNEPLRLRALKAPIDLAATDELLLARPALAELAGEAHAGELGTRLAGELVAGGKTPLWSLLSASLVDERFGSGEPPADAVVVVRTVKAQQGVTARFLNGFYAGLAASEVPAVGVEATRAEGSAIKAFARGNLSTVDDLDTQAGRLALAALLGGASPGSYGIKATARDGLLPPVSPVYFLSPSG